MKLALLILIWCSAVAIKGENCNGSHTSLGNMDQRASDFSGYINPYSNQSWFSDGNLPSGWYDVGRRNMPTDASRLQTLHSCGTALPIWMNGTIPHTSEGKVYRTACAKYDEILCYVAIEIEVINCGTHMLYKLSPVRSVAAYCFDPSLKVQPLLFFADEKGVEGKIYKKPKLVFRCQMNEILTDDLYYSVSWYVNDLFLRSKGPVLLSDLNDTNLYESELIESGYKLDISIKCIINSSNIIEGAPGNSTTSQQFWLGIRVLNPTVSMIQGRTTTIQLQPTFPFGCSSRVDDLIPQTKCLLSVRMFDPDDSNDCKSSSISVRESQKCGIQISGFYYHQWTAGVSYDNVTEMTITTRDPNDYHQGRNRFVLKLQTGGTGLNDIVQGSTISNIIITMSFETSWQAKTCYSYVDPHMGSFDGRSYENQNVGIFVLYRHRSSKQEVIQKARRWTFTGASKVFEYLNKIEHLQIERTIGLHCLVQMKTKRCNTFATCACAVAVRAGGDMFLIDLCRTLGLIKHVSCKENILNVRQRNPYLYKIHMPLGTMVSVAINNWWGFESTLNLNIYPSVKDVGETQGLCGVLNDNQEDDFMTPAGNLTDNNNVFSLSWSIDQAESFFDPQNHDPDLWDENSLFFGRPAVLNTATLPSTSSGSELDQLFSASLSLFCGTNVNLQGTQYQTCNIRTKRSRQSMSKEIERILRKEVLDNVIKTNNVEKRSVIAITFVEALDECTRFFDANCTTALFEDRLPSSNHNSMNNSITNCALDYTYTGDMSLASLHCETYRSVVDEEIGRNSTFREANPDVVESFRAMACINDCNNHGDCVNGSCICQASYIEEDCSVSLSNYPAVEDTYAGGLCQKDKDDCCGEVPIYGSRFIKGITKQKLEIFHIYLNGTKVVEEPSIQLLSILNPFEAQINVPCHWRSQRSTDSDNSSISFVTGTRVSLTNDGKHYGPAQSYYIQDSKCQGIVDHTDGYTFYLLDGTCFINGTCYNEREQDSFDGCGRCHPTINRFSWTYDLSDLSTDCLKIQPWLFFVDETGVKGKIFKKPKLLFRCQMNENMTGDLNYSVSWYVNDMFLLSKGPVLISEIDDTNLYEYELIESGYKLDINITCIINSSNSSEGVPGNSTTSRQFWLGIRVLNPTVSMIQGRTTTIQLQPTFPFGCSSRADDLNPQAKCFLSVHMFDPDDSNDCKSSSILVQESEKCGVHIPGFYYHQWTAGVSYDNVTEMTITTRDPNDYHQGRNRFVLQLLTEGIGLNDIVQGSYISNITVITSFETSWQAKTCYSHVDPHMGSFDGRSYENQNIGNFVLYRHRSSKQEVQMKTNICNCRATCACAVAVRAGGDMFLIDLCRSPRFIKHVSCKENILDVRQVDPYFYRIYMPLGTMVSVTINKLSGFESTLNLNVYPSVKDVRETEGLCGMLNDNQGDDFMTRSGNLTDDNNVFSMSWSINQNESFFDPQNHDPDLWDENSLFCVCPAALNTTTLPSMSSGNEFDPLCSASLSLSCSRNVIGEGTQYQPCNIRAKRSKQSMSKETERILRREVLENGIQNNNVEKRSCHSITSDKALEDCTHFFATSCTTALFKDRLPNSNHNSMNISIANCALDYMLTGDKSLASLHCETYRSVVDEEIGRNSTFREANPNVVESFRAMACINDCNNHGDCVNGSCICQDSYIEKDCSVSLSNYPAVEDTYAGGLCQKDKDECCGEIPIYGSRFVKGVTKQKLEIFNIYLSGTKVFEEPRIQVIPILNPFEAQIHVPCQERSKRSTDSDNSTILFVTGARVSLSNDGRNYGPAQSYYILDSKCQGILYLDGYTFYLLDGTCFISGTCYNEKEQDSLDRCKRCQPTINRFSWTYECTSSNDPLIVKDMTPILISVCIGTLLIVLVIVTITIIKCWLKKEKRISGHFEINVPVPTTGPRKFDTTLLFCSHQCLRDNGIESKRKNDKSNTVTRNNRPGTSGSLSSFQKIFLEMELPAN